MEAKITDMLSSSDSTKTGMYPSGSYKRMSTLARLNYADQPASFLMECATSSDSWVRDKVAQYPEPLPAEAYSVLALDPMHENRISLARRGDLPDTTKLLLASDRDREVREALLAAEGMDTDEHDRDVLRAEGHKFEDYRWALDARLNHPSPVVRQVALDSYTPQRGDSAAFGPEGDKVVDYHEDAMRISKEKANDILSIYRSIEDDHDQKVRYAEEMNQAAAVAVKHNRVREFQNARGVTGDVGALLSVRDLLPAGSGEVVLRPARAVGLLSD